MLKKIICIALAICLILLSLCACDRKTASLESESETPQPTEAAGDGGLVSAMEEANPPQEIDSTEWDASQNDFADTSSVSDGTDARDVAADETIATETRAVSAAQIFADATAQPNTSVSSYLTVSGTGLNFMFDYPSNWTNIPGRSTVCYVQPIENGTVYPARVAVTMKKLAHKCSGETEFKEELSSFCKTVSSQYDEKTFKIDTELNSETRFMDNKALSTTYLAYDGDQEIEGYVIMTYFGRYMFCFHFQCAYEDYEAFTPVMQHMRDSVKAEEEPES